VLRGRVGTYCLSTAALLALSSFESGRLRRAFWSVAGTMGVAGAGVFRGRVGTYCLSTAALRALSSSDSGRLCEDLLDLTGAMGVIGAISTIRKGDALKLTIEQGRDRTADEYEMSTVAKWSIEAGVNVCRRVKTEGMKQFELRRKERFINSRDEGAERSFSCILQVLRVHFPSCKLKVLSNISRLGRDFFQVHKRFRMFSTCVDSRVSTETRTLGSAICNLT
jgi:hypothetical protein